VKTISGELSRIIEEIIGVKREKRGKKEYLNKYFKKMKKNTNLN